MEVEESLRKIRISVSYAIMQQFLSVWPQRYSETLPSALMSFRLGQYGHQPPALQASKTGSGWVRPRRLVRIAILG